MLGTPKTPYRSDELRRWGGKGHLLIALSHWQAKVPPFVILPADLFSELGDWPDGVDGVELRRLVAERAQRPEWRERVTAIIRQGLEQLPETPFLAVRSSASDEDAAGASLAGQMDSFLNVPADATAVFDAVVGCWQSFFSDRAISYRKQKGLSYQGQSMAVVVQALCPAERSFVAFSANVLNRDPNQMLVSAVWGLGEALVSGAVDADQYVLDRDGKPVSRELGDQDQMSVPVPGGGVSMQPVPDTRKGQPVMSDADLQAIGKLLRRLEEATGKPVDIEGAITEDGCLYCLQCRPITTPIGGRKLLWDNSNIVESYSGVTTPLTFTFASEAYDIVYTLFGRMLGVPPELHLKHARTMRTYLGLMEGRVYYNLLTWYMSMAHLPGFAFTRGAMEGMMGVKESLNYELPAAGTGWQKWTRDFPRLLNMIGRVIYHFATIDRLVADFEARFQRHYSTLRDQDFSGWTADKLVDLWVDLKNNLMHHWQAPIMSDTGAMVSYALLRKLCDKWIPDGAGLQNDLLAGEGDIESTQPTKRLLAMAQKLQQLPTGKAALECDLDGFLAALASDPALAGIKTDWDDYLVRYGDRCMNELKLEEPSLREEPGFLLQVLRNYVAMPTIDTAKMEAQEKQVRVGAEAKAFASLGPLRRGVFRKVLGWTRKHVRNRENLRFARTRVYGLMRRIFLAIGDDFVREGVLRERMDVFYLTADEIVAYVDGRSVTKNLQALADLRRAEFDAHRQVEPDERFTTTGLPHWNQTYRGPQTELDLSDGELAGTPCCPGVVEQVTKLVRHPGDDMRLAGEILVAPRTDPGWVALYPSVSGLLIEKGSILSHSAIVARELGLPTIVGIKGLCDRLSQGQRVRMDGSTGRVEVLE